MIEMDIVSRLVHFATKSSLDMMEFFALEDAAPADAARCRSLFQGHTLLLVRVVERLRPSWASDALCVTRYRSMKPAVSFANLGQLTLDLLANSLLQRPEGFVRTVIASGLLRGREGSKSGHCGLKRSQESSSSTSAIC